MKIFLISFVILSIICGLNAHCVRNQPGSKCQERIFPEPEPKEIHYIYHGETCDCPKYHDIIVEKPVPAKKDPTFNYEYGVEIPKAPQPEEVTRYLFDVRVEKPIEKLPEKLSFHNYELHAPPKPVETNVRYIFDSRVEQPVKPCDEKPWQGLVSQVDRVLMPARDCQNSAHTPETCNCGCRDPSHTSSTCTCRSSNDDYKLPIIYNSRYDVNSDVSQHFPDFTMSDSRKMKRDTTSDKKSKRRDSKVPKVKPFELQKISSKDLKTLRTIDPVAKHKMTSKKTKVVRRQLKSNRKHDSGCGYTYESCDPKKHNKDGCPLCYRCQCDPIKSTQSNQKFSPYDLKMPYKFATQDEVLGSPATVQEFDYEPPTYTGLKEREMYKKYIQQIVSKYPEHMAQRTPVLQEQEQELLKFINDLAKADKSPGDKVETEDLRYKVWDDAMGLYRYYERAVNSKRKPKDGKLFEKRGTVLEVIELDPNDFQGDSLKIGTEDNLSESQ